MRSNLHIPKFGAYMPVPMECARPNAGAVVAPAPVVADPVELQEPAPAPNPLPPAAEPAVATPDEPQEPGEPESEDGATEFDAYLSARTGEVQLVGATIDEDGRVWLSADHVALVRRLLDWVPT